MEIKLQLHASYWVLTIKGFKREQTDTLEFLTLENALDYIRWQLFVEYNN